jgi:hypothetical protein
MNIIAGTLATDLRGNHNRQHPQQIPRNGQGKGRSHHRQALPPLLERKETKNYPQSHDGDQAPDAAASRRHLVLVVAGRVFKDRMRDMACWSLW